MKRPLRRNSDKRKLGTLVLFVVGVLLVGFLIPRVISLVSSIVLYPIHSTQHWLANTQLLLPALWRDKIELQTKVEELQAELLQQADEGISLQRLREENIHLRSLLGATTSKRIAASVIARPDQLPYDLLQIDQGSDAGIAVGAPVYSDDELVIGFIERVYPGSALVVLITTSSFEADAYVSGSNIIAPLEGLGGGVARVSVPQGVPLTVDSLVYLPSIQPGVFGRVVHIESEPTQPQQFGYIVSDIPLQHLRYVSVGNVNSVDTTAEVVEEYLDAIKLKLALPEGIQSTTTATSTATSSNEQSL